MSMSGFERALQGYSEPTAEEVAVDLHDVHEERRARARAAEREQREADARAASEAAEERRRQHQEAEDAAAARRDSEEAAEAAEDALEERLREEARSGLEEAERLDDAAEHGGGSSAPAESVQESAEPTPQQDDPDDGEHASSEPAEEPIPDEPEEEEDEGPEEQQEEDEPEEPPAEEPEPEPQEAPAPVERAPREPSKQPARRPGAQAEVSRFDFENSDNADDKRPGSVTFKKFPVRLVDGLRSTLAAHLGEDEAASLGSQAVVAAFVSAKTGLDVGLDPSSRRAAEAFAANDPGMLGVLHETGALREDFDELVRRIGPMIRRVAEISTAMDAIELSNAFALTDRYDNVTTPQTRSHEIDLEHPKVLATRDRVASAAADQRRLRQEREHRSNR